ncbi:hypothetical protein V8C35DRAFT_9319 [Trichoderma chlorosporum]
MHIRCCPFFHCYHCVSFSKKRRGDSGVSGRSVMSGAKRNLFFLSTIQYSLGMGFASLGRKTVGFMYLWAGVFFFVFFFFFFLPRYPDVDGWGGLAGFIDFFIFIHDVFRVIEHSDTRLCFSHCLQIFSKRQTRFLLANLGVCQ